MPTLPPHGISADTTRRRRFAVRSEYAAMGAVVEAFDAIEAMLIGRACLYASGHPAWHPLTVREMEGKK